MIDTKPTTNGHGLATLQTPTGAKATRGDLAGSRMTYSRLIGALFLAGFLFYGVGSGLATSLVGGSNFLSTIAGSQTMLVIGAFLMLFAWLLIHRYRLALVANRAEDEGLERAIAERRAEALAASP